MGKDETNSKQGCSPRDTDKHPVITGQDDVRVVKEDGLAIPGQSTPIYADAQPNPDPEIIERFCQVWAEVGRAILVRRGRVAA